MKRCHIKQGDKTTAGGDVLEGIPNTYHYDALLSFVGAKIYCPTCKSQGFIDADGPRFPDDFMGRRPALENDICVCKCETPPRLLASQGDMYEEYSAADLAGMGFAPNGLPLQKVNSNSTHAQRIFVCDSTTGQPLVHQDFVVNVEGDWRTGRTDSDGFATIMTDGARMFRLHVVFASPKRNLKPTRHI